MSIVNRQTISSANADKPGDGMGHLNQKVIRTSNPSSTFCSLLDKRMNALQLCRSFSHEENN